MICWTKIRISNFFPEDKYYNILLKAQTLFYWLLSSFFSRDTSCHFKKYPTGGAKDKRHAVLKNSLALEQHVGLSEQRNLWSQAPLTVGQVADVTAQLLLALPARLQLALQPPQLLLQPESHRE